MSKERKRYIGLIMGIFFWIGFGLSSLINIIKTVYTKNVLTYDLIMFLVSIVFVIIALAYLFTIKKRKTDS